MDHIVALHRWVTDRHREDSVGYTYRPHIHIGKRYNGYPRKYKHTVGTGDLTGIIIARVNVQSKIQNTTQFILTQLWYTYKLSKTILQYFQYSKKLRYN